MEQLDVQIAILWHVVVAMFFGAALGFEREAADKPAGLRTHMFVAGMASLVVLLAELIIERATGSFDNTIIGSDPIRIIDAVITGVSFLGAGTIFRHPKENAIEGLTTAASLLFTAAIGITVALDQLLVALGLVALALFVLHGLARVSSIFGPAAHADGGRQNDV